MIEFNKERGIGMSLDAKEMRFLLVKLDACKEAREWAADKSLAEIWQTCERGDWLLWLLGRMTDAGGWPTHQKVVLASCSCAETVLTLWEHEHPTDWRPRQALAAARAWAGGKASVEEVRNAAYAAAAASGASGAAAARFEKQKECADIVRATIPKFHRITPKERV